MKILQIGVGSMGKRRIRNMKYLGFHDILAFDMREDRLYEAKDLYGVEILLEYKDVKWEEITHVIVSTSPDKHMQYAIDAVKNNKHVFIEASVVDENMDILHSESKDKDVVVAPSCTMRFDPIVIKTKELLEGGKLGRVLFVNHHFGQYLPYWHPYENIQDFYVSKRETGAAREIIPFDLVYLSWLFGKPTSVTAMITNTGTLNVDIDDIYSLLYRTKDGTQVNMTIDVVSKVSYRYTNIIAENGNIELDNVKGTLSYFDADEEKWEHYTRSQFAKTVSTEEMYVKEMQSFVSATKGIENYPYTLEEDHEVLKFLYLSEQSQRESKILKVDING